MEGIGLFESTITAQTGSYPGKKDIARCVICGFEGEYGVEVIETDIVDSLGHDTTKPMCRKVKDCLDRHEASLISK